MIEAHRALREGTHADHEALDALFARFDLKDRASYTRFLAAHAVALLPVEAALDASATEAVTDDWPIRRRGDLILADLEELGEPSRPTASGQPITDPAAIAGALYVIEGSRLGGRMLARAVGEGLPKRYLDADQPAGNWRALLSRLDAVLADADATTRAVAAARHVFAGFAAAGARELERVE